MSIGFVNKTAHIGEVVAKTKACHPGIRVSYTGNITFGVGGVIEVMFLKIIFQNNKIIIIIIICRFSLYCRLLGKGEEEEGRERRPKIVAKCG